MKVMVVVMTGERCHGVERIRRRGLFYFLFFICVKPLKLVRNCYCVRLLVEAHHGPIWKCSAFFFLSNEM